jgi:TolA-binding protein
VANAAKPASPPPKDLRPAARPEIPSGRDSTASDYQVALGKFEAKLYDQALADARLLLEEHPTSSVAPQTYLLVAQIHLAQDHNEDAMAALIELHNRYPKDPRAPEALFQLAQLVLQSKRKDKELDAAGTFGELADQYPTNPWAVRALAAKAQLEEREKMRQQDPISSLTVPSELVTYRALVERFPTASAAEIALWKLGELYSEIKRYDLAVQSYAKLGEGFPNTQYDAWFEAGELYEKKLKDAAQAMAAYLKVPDRSRHFKEAQKRASKLQND